jgi:hypothetical protein
MPATLQSALELLQDLKPYLLDESALLASPEDAAFFRSRAAKKKLPEPLLPPPLPIAKPAPPPPIMQPPVQPPPAVSLPESPPPKKVEPPPSKKPSLGPLRDLLHKIAPDLEIIDQVPSDALAKKQANLWKTKNQSAPISILSFGEPPEHRLFLRSIWMALNVHFGPASLIEAGEIEKEKTWDAFFSVPDLKLIVICDSTLWQLQALMRHYKENPTNGSRTLGSANVFLLPDLSLYLKDPLLKKSLWKGICSILS